MRIIGPDGNEHSLPDFHVPGAAKSGTTNMHFILSKHPSIFMPAIKETYFFSSYSPGRERKRTSTLSKIATISDYSSYFKDSRSDQISGDASPSYLYTHNHTIPALKKTYACGDSWKKLRFVIMLRNPIERAWSQYCTHRKLLRDDLPFEKAIDPEIIKSRKNAGYEEFFDYIGFGMYCDQIKAYWDAFGFDKVKVILFDDWRNDSVSASRNVFAFLGVEPSIKVDQKGAIRNLSGEPYSKLLVRLIVRPGPLKKTLQALGYKRLIPDGMRWMIKYYLLEAGTRRMRLDEKSRSVLRSIYAEEIGNLSKLLNRDLGGWLK